MNILELLIISVGILTAVGIISSISPSTKQDTYHTHNNRTGRFYSQYGRNHHAQKGIKQEEFEEIARKYAKKDRRIKSITIKGSKVYGVIESQTGYSTWNFEANFEYYDNYVGKYNLRKDVTESLVPEHFCKKVCEEIQNRLST